MAKAYITQSKRIGSVGGETYSVVKGQTIVRAKPVSVANPRTDAQMTQRTQFLSAVRFYQRATQRFFKFAFEGKKAIESDYNAFMRLNAKIGGYLTKAQSDAAGFPMIAPFIMTQGSLGAPVYGLDAILHGDNSASQMVLGAAEEGAEAFTTIAQVSENILATYPSYRAGDIVTIVSLWSNVTGEFWNDLDAATFTTSGNEIAWDINQFIIDTNDDTLLSVARLSATIADGKHILEKVIAPRGAVCGCVVVVSRNETSGLKVSNSQVSLSAQAIIAYDAMREAAHLQQVLAWWGAQQIAVLQGAVAVPAERTRKARLNSVNGDFSLPVSINVAPGTEEVCTLGFNSSPVGVTTDDFRVEGFQSNRWELTYSGTSSQLMISAAENAQGTASVYYRNQLIIKVTASA